MELDTSNLARAGLGHAAMDTLEVIDGTLNDIRDEIVKRNFKLMVDQKFTSEFAIQGWAELRAIAELRRKLTKLVTVGATAASKVAPTKELLSGRQGQG